MQRNKTKKEKMKTEIGKSKRMEVYIYEGEIAN